MKKCVVFAPIAEREVLFYLEFAEHAKRMNLPLDVQFISFYQGGNEILLNKGYKVWDIFDWSEKIDRFKVSDEQLENYFAIPNLHKLILHEKVTFGITDNQLLYDKYYKYLNGLDLILQQIMLTFPKEDIVVLQELGGFVAPLSLLHNCLQKKIKHTFFEPSFFKGTMNFIENSFVSSFKALSEITQPAEKPAVTYLEQVRAQRQLVIPQKDTHHYQDMGLKKLFNAANAKKLLAKIYLKYVKKQKQEYQYISNHVIRNLRQFLNRRRSENLYREQLPKAPFIYFPFHVQLDVQLTIRNPEYFNQLAFVELICQVLPRKYKLVVKEHPASIGGFSAARLSQLLKDNENLVLLRPMLNTYEILDKTAGVITINSKVGAEAVALGHAVACMGHGFYWNSEVVKKLNSSTELIQWLEDLSQGKIKKNSQNDVERYFSEIFRMSYPFELYNHSPDNLKNFCQALESYLIRL